MLFYEYSTRLDETENRNYYIQHIIDCINYDILIDANIDP
jgi:hypothetical protein